MCVHHWILDSTDRGVCKLCGAKKSFAQRPIRLNKYEKEEVKHSFNDQFYHKGGLCRNVLNAR